MAARGLVPVRGAELVLLLCQLSADPDAAVSETASRSLRGLPDEVLLPACEASLPAPVVAALADAFPGRDDVLERLVRNTGCDDETLVRLARGASERLGELIALDQARLLRVPAVIEALYRNRNVRMSTVDRLVELAVREGIRLDGIPQFDAYVAALRTELIPEPEPGEEHPMDADWRAAASEDEDEDAVDVDAADGSEAVKKRFVPLHQRIQRMGLKEKLRLAVTGNAAARALLVRDRNPQVARAAIAAPGVTDVEAVAVARSKEVSEDVIRYVAGRREWLRNYELKRALLFNPKTPLGTALSLLSHMHPSDLRDLSRSRNVPGPLKTAAAQRLAARQKGGG